MMGIGVKLRCMCVRLAAEKKNYYSVSSLYSPGPCKILHNLLALSTDTTLKHISDDRFPAKQEYFFMDDGARIEATQEEDKETARLCYAISFILI